MSAGDDFYGAPPADQVRRLEELGANALKEWGLEGAVMDSVAYRENMTFKVSAGERGAYALRIHQANYRTDDEIQSELDMMTFLESEGIRTPRVVPTRSGALFTTASAPGVPEPRQCDVFEWIEGRLLRSTGQPIPSDLGEMTAAYREVGGLAARIYNATEKWDRPAGFTRPAWDAEGMFGVNAHLGDFRKLEGVPEDQMGRLCEAADKLTVMLDGFGKTPDRWGLSHGDFLAENIFVCDGEIRLVDFDDAGDSWHMLDITTAVFDLLETPAYEPCLAAMVQGYRAHRDLPDSHLEMLPAFFLARVLSYLGWCAKKPHMPQTAFFRPVLLAIFDVRWQAFQNA